MTRLGILWVTGLFLNLEGQAEQTRKKRQHPLPPLGMS